MNLSDINTPADLVKLNAAKLDRRDNVVKELAEMTYSDHRLIFDVMVESFIDLHCHLIDESVDKNDIEAVVKMARDLQTLLTVKQMMEDV